MFHSFYTLLIPPLKKIAGRTFSATLSCLRVKHETLRAKGRAERNLIHTNKAKVREKKDSIVKQIRRIFFIVLSNLSC